MNKFRVWRNRMCYLLREGAFVVYLVKLDKVNGQKPSKDMVSLSHEATHVKNVNWKTLGVRMSHDGWALYQ